MRSHVDQMEMMIFDRLPSEIREFLAIAPFRIDSGVVETAWLASPLPIAEFVASLQRGVEKHAGEMNEMIYGPKLGVDI